MATLSRARKSAAAPRALRRGTLPAARRNPVHPGYFLDTRFLKPLNITQQALAHALGISRRRVNELIRGHRGISADTAVRLGMYFGNDPAFWMELQSAWDIQEAIRRIRDGSAPLPT
jgi:addiction module HigA family antidote